MQTFHIEKTPIVPTYCLWVSGLLLISGCRVDGGRPRLQSACLPAGNRLAMGDKAPGAWGALGADSMQKAAGLASLWAGGDGVGAKTAQSSPARASLCGLDFLLWGAVSSAKILSPAGKGAGIPENVEGTSQKAPEAPPIAHDQAHAIPLKRSSPDDSCKTKVLFIPKPKPWNCADAGGGRTLGSLRPPSFCSRVVTFTPTPNLVR